MRAVRADLLTWSPPEPDFAFRLVAEPRVRRRRRCCVPPVPTWRAWFTPAAGFAAAAVLVLAAAAGLARVDVHKGPDGWTLRTGSPAQYAVVDHPFGGATAHDVNLTAAADSASLLSIERRIAALEAVSHDSNTVRNAGFVTARASTGDVLKVVRDLLAQSETRQKGELALRIAQLIRDVDAQRVADLNRVQQGIGRIDASVADEAAAHRELMNYIPDLEHEDEIGVTVKRTSLLAAALVLAASGVRAQESQPQAPGAQPTPQAPAAATAPTPGQTADANTPGGLTREKIQRIYHIRQIESMLTNAVKAGAVSVANQIRVGDPNTLFVTGGAHTRGFELEGYGIFFDVDVPPMLQSAVWSLQELQQRQYLDTLQRRLADPGLDDNTRRMATFEMRRVQRAMANGQIVPVPGVSPLVAAPQAAAQGMAVAQTTENVTSAPAAPQPWRRSRRRPIRAAPTSSTPTRSRAC